MKKMKPNSGYFQVHLGWRIAPPCVLRYRLGAVPPQQPETLKPGDQITIACTYAVNPRTRHE